jgi:hypothetical protein
MDIGHGTRFGAALLLTATSGLAACGGDDEPSAAEAKAAYCAVDARIDNAFSPLFARDLSEEELAQGMSEIARGLADDVEEARRLAPDAITEDVAILTDSMERGADGDGSAFFEPDADAARTRVDAFCR